MSRKNKRYSEEFQLSVIRDYYSSGMSKKACVRKYQLSSDSVLLYWLRKHDSAKESLPLQSESNEDEMANRSKDMETLSRDMMIDKAEEYFDIAIRKKSGAK